MKALLPVLCAFALVLALPFAFRTGKPAPARNAGGSIETLTIAGPHNESIRHEFITAFERHMQEKGRNVVVEWRSIGGASEISLYLASEYLAAFRNYWQTTLHRPWTAEVQGSFDDIRSGTTSGARRAFLASNVSCGIDVLFGGGAYDFQKQADAGRLVDCGIVAAHPELYGTGSNAIPQAFSGEKLWDNEGRWVGACMSSFGITFSLDVLKRLGLPPLRDWSDLSDPRLDGQVALTDPTKSGSAAKAFELMIQQQMQLDGDPVKGWARAMRMLRRITANARYFTDAGAKPAIDACQGEAAAGMSIDYYARFTSESVARPDGSSRLGFVTPPRGTSFGADPIGMLRGAPRAELAREFIEFVISLEGQKIWNYRLGTPGGPEQYALRRLPIRKELYTGEMNTFRSDAKIFPYVQGADFIYRAEWTARLLGSLSFVIRVSSIESADELRDAWRALIAHKFPPAATARFDDVSAISYDFVRNDIYRALASHNRIEEIRLAKTLGDTIRAQYREVKRLAEAGE